jgi:hypothetical protein
MTEPTRVYVVTGETGEYEDREEWPVAAYLHRETAEQHRDLANGVTKDSVEPSLSYGGTADEYMRRKGEARAEVRRLLVDGNPYDPGMKIAYTGVEYAVVAVPLFRHVDEFLERLADGKQKGAAP